jgi:predicted ATPase
LFVEEMTKSVLESGHLKEVDGEYELSGLISTLTIPATLQDSLMSRLDRLVTAKAVAQYASVIGRQFSYELLHAVAQLDEPTLQRELGRLVEAELVYQRGLPPHATYTFKYALIQDTAYASLLRSTRQGYHRRIAEVLEERFPETTEQPALLAHHYTEAGLPEQAVHYWQRAGEHASDHSAYLEAISHFTTGIELLTTLPETPERTQRALDVARRQEAKALELRAATSLARLWQSQDKRQEAYDLLAPVYNWFTEGFNTADLQEAKQLLDELAA